MLKYFFFFCRRCLYSDTTDLSEDTALDVMRIAHKYQVTTCLSLCSEILRSVIRDDNVLCILEHAFLYNDKKLTEAAINFIDDNAQAVIESEEFESIRQETLEYILKGNTFFAPELDILKAVDKWAANQVANKAMTTDSASKRLAMGKAFYHLRLPTLSLRDFITAQHEYAYLTYEEEKNTSNYIITKDTSDLCNSTEERIPRKAIYAMSALEYDETTSQDLMPYTSTTILTCTKDIEVEEVTLFSKLNCPFNANVKIETSGQKVIGLKSVKLKPSINQSIKFVPAVELKISDGPFNVVVSDLIQELNTSKSQFSVENQSSTFGRFGQVSSPGGFSFGSVKSTFGGGIGRSICTQTERNNESCEGQRSVSSPVNLKSKDNRSCIVKWIRYINKSNRAIEYCDALF